MKPLFDENVISEDIPFDDPSILTGGHGVLYRYWDRLRGGRFAPARGEIEPTEIPGLLSRISLLVVEPEPLRFRYRLSGTAINEAHGLEMTNRYVDELEPPAFARQMHDWLARLVHDRRPQLVEWHYLNQTGRPRHYRVLRLPLSSNGEDVDMIMILTEFDLPPRSAGSSL
jgi:hypothetical protein